MAWPTKQGLPATGVKLKGYKPTIGKQAKPIKLFKKHKAKPKLGTGKRFAQLKGKLAHQKGVTNPGALAAYIGRRKYGAKRMGALSSHGKKHKTLAKTMCKKHKKLNCKTCG